MPDLNYEKAIELSKEYYMKARMWSLVFAGGAFLVFAYFTFDGIRFYVGSSVAEATVTQLRVEKSKSISWIASRRETTVLRPYVEFQDSNGSRNSRKLATLIGFGFDTDIGATLQIRYNPEMPEDVRLSGFLRFWMASIFSIGLIALALGFSVLFAKKKPTNTIINYYLKRLE